MRKARKTSAKMTSVRMMSTKAAPTDLAAGRDVLGCTVERRQEAIGLLQLRAGHSLIDLVDVAGKLGRMGDLSLQVLLCDFHLAVSEFLPQKELTDLDLQHLFGMPGEALLAELPVTDRIAVDLSDDSRHRFLHVGIIVNVLDRGRLLQ